MATDVRIGLTSTDAQYLGQLGSLTNVIPLLAHADTLTTEQIAASKERIAKQLDEAGLKLFTFASTASNMDEGGIYAVSSELESDLDVMDASLLMSSDYVQPLVSTNLSCLLESLFSVDGAAWLRHTAATNLLSWRLRHPGVNNGSSGFAMRAESSSSRQLLRTRAGSMTPLAMSRVPSYALCEGRFCRLQLTNWAADLQRSLANERLMQERRAREQAAIWLREPWRDGHSALGGDGRAMALTRTKGKGERQKSICRRRHSTGSDQNWALVRHQDPLGLLQLKADFKWQSWNAVEMVGGLGLLGGLAWLLV